MYIKFFNQISLKDVKIVGGKNAALGQMIQYVPSSMCIPDGFAITVDGYRLLLEKNNLTMEIHNLINSVHKNLDHVHEVGTKIRTLVAQAQIPHELMQEIFQAYQELSQKYGVDSCDVAVRSSATAEDSASASFAGQQETFVNIVGAQAVVDAYHKACISLFTDRSIAYRIEKKINEYEIGISVGVQKMVRSDLGSSGVMFTLDTETGFKDVVLINASYGLGESVVSGAVNPDEFCIDKRMLSKGYKPLIKKTLGSKATRMVYGHNGGVVQEVTPVALQNTYSLSDEQVFELARQAIILEKYFSDMHGAWTPLDIEWALDGRDNKLYIVQARPETVHVHEQGGADIAYYTLDDHTAKLLVSGQAIGQKIVTGTARVIKNFSDVSMLQAGDILVTTMTNPDWVPYMKKAVGIVTDFGGRTCHAAIVSRELGLTAVVGTEHGTSTIKNGQKITLDCSNGSVGSIYDGVLVYHTDTVSYKGLRSQMPLLVNLADPDSAFKTSFLPTQGVGLARLEFIITHMIGIHPMALIQPEKLDNKTRQTISTMTAGYASNRAFFIERLSQALGMIASAFYPRQVIVRLSDFKTNEYRNFIGGSFFEHVEENPMLGMRGAARYTDAAYAPAFELECAALVHARTIMGFDNIKIMIPFVRTVSEAERVIDKMASYGLSRGVNNLELYMMVEIPSNVILIKEFSALFDGFSIGSNDLTQLTLGVDRDSTSLVQLFDERDPAVKKMIQWAIAGAHEAHKPIGICGQAPSDYPEMAQFLIDEKIDSLSLNADAIIPFLLRIADKK
jgi:pyruvate,water dikinase